MNEQLLHHLQDNYEVQGRVPELRICCPDCGDNRFRFGVNVATNKAHCFNCGLAFRSKETLNRFFGLEENPIYSLGYEDPEVQLLKALSETDVVPPTQAQWLQVDGIRLADYHFLDLATRNIYAGDFILACSYLESRGFHALKLASEYGLILANPTGRLRGRIVIPLLENGEMVYWQARSFKDEKPKYMNPPKNICPSGKSNFVFNLPTTDSNDTAVICEGVFSALSVGKIGMAILGKEMSEEQAKKILMSPVKTFVIMLDPGEEKASLKIAAKLFPRKIVKIARLIGGDPNELPKKEVEGAIQKAELVDETSLLRAALEHRL